jgi:ribonuclease HII
LISEEETARIEEMLAYENRLWRQGVRFVAGIDEAGRGPLAGPVVAAAVVFPEGVFIAGMDDSKKLSPNQREDLFNKIKNKALSVATGIVSEKEIDRMNILQATFKAMRMAVGSLSVRPEHLLVDGRALPEKFYPQTPLVRGDQKSFSIAAASIVAKVTRDRMMVDLDALYPEYGFARHKGYGTKEHVEGIRKHGLCEIHRKSFHVKGWTDR